MEHFFHVEGVAAALAIIAFAWAIVKWFYSLIRAHDTLVKLVHHIYSNELPHIEHAVRRLCVKMGIDYDDPPPPPML